MDLCEKGEEDKEMSKEYGEIRRTQKVCMRERKIKDT